MAQKYTEAKKRNNQKWDSENYSRLNIVGNKELLAKFKTIVADNGNTINGTVIDFIRKYVEENSKTE